MNDEETTKFASIFLIGIVFLILTLGAGAYLYSIYM